MNPLIATLLKPFRRSTEGQPTPGPWYVHNPDGWLPTSWGSFMNYWQMGHDPIGGGTSAVAEACVAAYAQTIAMCPGDHWITKDDGGRERQTNSQVSRVLRHPNDYQTRSDFVLNLVRALYLHGNTYALAQRNARFEVTAFHPFDPKQSKPLVSVDGDIFYQLGGNNVLQPKSGLYGTTQKPFGVVPARDVLHVKLEAKADDPLMGIPPLRHAAMSVAAQNMIGSQLLNFFGNMSRPSGVLSTDLSLTKEQVEELRLRWNEQAKGLNAGGVPILTNGLKFNPISTNAKDSDLINALKLSQEEVFMVFGVPPAIIGMTDKGTFASTEALMQFWLSRGLGFAINHVETAFDHFFGLRGWPHEYVEFDTSALLRVAFKDRIEALVRGVQGAVFAPDEARHSEDLPTVPGGFGKEPRVQQQVVPLSAWAKAPPKPATPVPAAPPAPPPAAPPAKSLAELTAENVVALRAMKEARHARH